jgi:hypothetical protein
MSQPATDQEARLRMWLCPACGSAMYLARQLKGYPKTGEGSERRTCALHGPLGQFHHIATDRKPASGDSGQA